MSGTVERKQADTDTEQPATSSAPVSTPTPSALASTPIRELRQKYLSTVSCATATATVDVDVDVDVDKVGVDDAKNE